MVAGRGKIAVLVSLFGHVVIRANRPAACVGQIFVKRGVVVCEVVIGEPRVVAFAPPAPEVRVMTWQVNWQYIVNWHEPAKILLE